MPFSAFLLKNMLLLLCPPPLRRREGILLCTCWLVGLSVRPSVTFWFPINISIMPRPTFLVHTSVPGSRGTLLMTLHTFVQLFWTGLSSFYKTSVTKKIFRGHYVLQTSLVFICDWCLKKPWLLYLYIYTFYLLTVFYCKTVIETWFLVSLTCFEAVLCSHFHSCLKIVCFLQSLF